MPGGFPLGYDLCNAQTGANAAASTGIAVNPGASAHAKGSYVTLIAATASDDCWMDVDVVYTADSQAGIDISVGVAGSEKVVVNNLFPHNAGGGKQNARWSFPLSIPTGTRISARSQDSGGSASNGLILVSTSVYDGAYTQMEGAAGVDALGFTAASTSATTITGSGSTNTKGAYAVISAATPKDYIGLMVALTTTTSPASNCGMLIDVAVGVGGSEKIILPNLSFEFGFNAKGFFPAVVGPFFIAIPAGTRLAARHQCSVASVNCGMVIHGIYQ